jgi:hypothetical protein
VRVNGELAQVITLAAHGSAWLARRGGDPPFADRGNVTFRHVEAVAFDLCEPRAADLGHAESVSGWLTQLRERGIDRLWLVIPPDRRDAAFDVEAGTRVMTENELVGFVGAGSWSLLATGDDRTESWSASWNHWTHPDGSRAERPWRVQYVGQGLDAALPQGERAPPTIPIGEAQTRLLAQLTIARDFAQANSYEPWPDVFAKAIAIADPIATPILPGWCFPGDGSAGCFPEHGFSAASQRLLAIADQAWVFGGMSWWGDWSFKDPAAQAECDRIGEVLYTAVLQACAASINAPLVAP